MLGMVLLYVGAVLCLNGLWLLGRIGDNEIAVIDIFVGGLTLLVSLYLAFGPGSNPANIKAAALLGGNQPLCFVSRNDERDACCMIRKGRRRRRSFL